MSTEFAESGRWWLSLPGQEPLGPYRWPDLIRTVRQSGGLGDWMACAEGSSEWRRLDSDPRLVDALRPPPPPPMPMGAPGEFPDPHLGGGLDRPQSDPLLVFMHLSVLSGIVVPLGGLLVPLILWLLNRGRPRYDAQGKEVMNWVLCLAIGIVVGAILSIVVVGVFLLAAVAVCMVVFAIIGAVKASEGQFYRYPLPFRLIK
jgi:uncharacterized Tic20 family protein